MYHSVVIATPFYEQKCFSNYLTSMLLTTNTMTKMGIKWDVIFIVGDSYVDRARNAIVQRFLHEESLKQFDKLFFIDSDMRWNTEAFLKMIELEEEFVGAAYPMKNRFEDFSVRHYLNEDKTPVVNENGLIDSQLVPGGFLCLKRSCLETMNLLHNSNSYVDRSSGYDGFTVNLFECRVLHNCRQGEDSAFCEKWRTLNKKIWCYPNVDFGHIGIKEYTGNYHQTLLGCPRPETIEERLTRVINRNKINQTQEVCK